MERELIELLVENSGPVIRYLITTELLDDDKNINFNSCIKEFIESVQVRKWLDRLVFSSSFNDLHGGRITTFENVIGKLTEFGIKSGMAHLDKRVLPFIQWLAANFDKHKGMLLYFSKIIITFGLARAGYTKDEAVKLFLNQRLEYLYQSTRKSNYDIYVDQNNCFNIPRVYHGKPILKSEFCPEGEFMLPYVYDVYALACVSPSRDTEIQKKINTIIRYILHPEYQSLPDDYGYMEDPYARSRIYAIGWHVNLPGYHGFEFNNFKAGYFVQRLELMAHFEIARKHKWFKDSLEHLETFRTRRGTYLFPRPYIQERNYGYWVTGAYNGLEENRRSNFALELESTFRVLRIKKIAKI